jgi:hypothetical protein
MPRQIVRVPETEVLDGPREVTDATAQGNTLAGSR